LGFFVKKIRYNSFRQNPGQFFSRKGAEDFGWAWGRLGEKRRLLEREVEILPPCGCQNDTGACLSHTKARRDHISSLVGFRKRRSTQPTGCWEGTWRFLRPTGVEMT